MEQIRVSGLCGEELDGYVGYGVYVSDGTTTPPTWKLATATYPEEGILVDVQTTRAGVSLGESCTVCVFGKVNAVAGEALSPAFGPLIAGSSGTLLEADNGGADAQAYAMTATASGATREVLVNYLQSNREEISDKKLPLSLHSGTGDGGTWTKAISSNVPIVTRTGASSIQSFYVEVSVPNRESSTRGVKPTGCQVSYAITGETAVDVQVQLLLVTPQATGTAPTATVLFGDADADYGADHNTSAERVTVAEHTMTLTNAGTAAVLDGDSKLVMKFYFNGTGKASAVFIIRNAVLHYTEV